MFVNMTRSSITLAAALALSLALSACAHNDNLAAGYGAAGRAPCRSSTRRSATASSHHRSDQSSQTAQATLDKQAAWLNQYNKYSFTVEGHADERGTTKSIRAWLTPRRRRSTTISPPRASPLRA